MKQELNFDEITSTIVKTIGFNGLNSTTQDEIFKIALSRITEKTDFIVFKKEATQERYEDENRTLVIPYDVQKVYVKLDDYKGNEQHNFNKRFAITFMLADEY